MKKMYNFIAVIFVISTLGGCATMADSITSKGSGSFATYEESYDVVWESILGIIVSSDLQLVSKDKKSGQILAQQGISVLSYGENVAVFVEKVGNEVRTRVEVVSKKAMATNIFAANWETYILKKLDTKFTKIPMKSSN